MVTEAGSYLRHTYSCITQLKAQGPSGTCSQSKEEAGGAREAPLSSQRETVGVRFESHGEVDRGQIVAIGALQLLVDF